MCLILFSYRVHPRWPLVIAANRDEFHQRPTAAAHFWPPAPQLLAGRDLQAGGTWMGITRQGRFAAVTNYRDPAQQADYPHSRGALPSDFLTGNLSAEDYLVTIDRQHDQFAGFNLLLGSVANLFFYSNQQRSIMRLSPGIYGLSNGRLDEAWPKVIDGKKQLATIIEAGCHTDQVIRLLNDRTLAEDDVLPSTGIDVGMEKILSAKFIDTETYGTRSSTVITVDDQQHLCFTEQSYDAAGQHMERKSFQFNLQD